VNVGNWITLGIFAAGLFITIIGGYYAFVRNIEKRVTIVEQRCTSHQATIDSIASLNSRIDKVTSDNETFWKILGPHLAGIIHSPKSRTRDELVDELISGCIDADGAKHLVELLIEAIGSDRWTGDKRLAGALLLARTKAKLAEMQAAETVRRKY
jgi:hypothetical protein